MIFNLFKKKKQISEEVNLNFEEDFTNILPISEYFHRQTGISFDTQISILKNKVTSFCKQRDIYSFSYLLKKLHSDKKLNQELIDYLTVNETFFYREFKQIEDLVKLVKEETHPVSILCAPSATGEEPYSIAIALLQSGIHASAFKILGIDINSDAIQKAKDARYNKRNLRNLSRECTSKYFLLHEEKYILKEEVKSLVSFRVINIFDESFKTLGRFDFIFSRNMLIYFDKETKIKAKKILEHARKNNDHEVFFGHADLF